MHFQDRAKGESLRKRAEKILSQKPQDVRKVPVEDIKRLIHELDVHQIELDMQNDELRRAQDEIELSRAKAGEIHDSIGHGLFSMKHLIELWLTRIREEGPETELKRLEIFTSILDNTMAEVKRMQQNLRPSLLEDVGVLVTIGWLCREFAEAHPDIRVDQNVTIEEKEVPPSLKLAIFRILQEALNNVAKHGKASLARLSLNKGSKEIELTLSDNGQGFDVKERSRHGLGLVSMRERAELSNGVFSIESVKDKGTTIRITWAL